MFRVEMIWPSVEIVPNRSLESSKRLNLLPLYEEDVTIYMIGENYVKKINRGNNNYEYIVNGEYSLKTADTLSDDELISLLFIYI